MNTVVPGASAKTLVASIPGEELPARIEAAFDRRAMPPRIGVLVVLFVGALIDYGHGHRAGHWVVLAAYGLATIALSQTRASADGRVAHRFAFLTTLLDALIAVYAIIDHLPLSTVEPRYATDAVSLLPAFLFLMQTGFRLRPLLVLIFAGVVLAGWSVALALTPNVAWPGSDSASFVLREAVGIAAFAAAAGFVLYASASVRGAAASTLRAWEERFLLSRFLPTGIASEVVRPGGTGTVAERHATVMSVDLRGSSTLARAHPPSDFVSWLLEFRALVHDAVTSSGGIVDKYVGDGVLALFLESGAGRQATAALGAAGAISNAIDDLNRRREAAGLPLLRVILSIHAGQVLAGVFDDGRRAEFTVLGACMNDLSRIERRAKEANCDVVASTEVVQAIPHEGRGEWSAKRLAPPSQSRALPELFSLLPTRGEGFRSRACDEPELLAEASR